ncbi:MAG: PAS domain-containing protein [Actinomycetota bacterium]|jgi:PAS domain S-box-containing protein|nr:PAS domain-containing protein [Actinomycetota bacterium]MCL6092214.1 PAS domain-containing protein [Actinomycetota bacterium]MDA8167672.1 PAS domain-containing protein [Actinomycetota bacterium]
MDINGAEDIHAGGRPPGKGACLDILDIGVLEVLDSLPFYVMLIDRNHRIMLVNKAVRNGLNREPEEIIGAYCPKVVHGLADGEEYPGCPLEAAVRKDEPIEWEHFDDKIGRWLRTGIYPTASRLPDGEKIYFHMVADITEQKNAESKVRRSEEKYRLLLEELIKPL